MRDVYYILGMVILAVQSAKIGEIDDNSYDFENTFDEDDKKNYYLPPVDEKYKNEKEKEKEEILLPSSTIGRFWHLSDLHLDFYYNENARASNVCPSSFGAPAIHPGRFGDYRCDSPWTLINSSIYAMKKKYPDPDFILWTGDDTLHTSDEERYLSEEIVLETIKNITILIQDVFPNVKVYSALGNHDHHPKNNMPIGKTPFLEGVAETWKSWLSAIERVVFEDGGFYLGESDKFTNLHVIVLNTNLWYENNKEINATAESDPGGQFEFLRSNLEHADADTKFYIIGHIPPGYFEIIDDIHWLHEKYSSRYVQLIKEFSHKIAGQFFGHHHTDSFRVFKDEFDNAVSSIWIAPGVTPWMTTLPGVKNGANNPGIRLFEFDKATLQPTDYLQYYLNLQKANSDDKTDWKLEYRATSAYGIENISPLNMGDVLKRLEAADPSCQNCNATMLLNKYSLFNSVSYNDAPCDATCQRYHVCAIGEFEAEGYTDCITTDGTNPVTHSSVSLFLSLSILVSSLLH